MFMNRNLIIAFILVVVVIGAGHWLWGNRSGDSNEPIKIGVATLLSGNFAALGENIVNAARLTVDEINANGGVNGRRLEIISEDARVDGRSGLLAVRKLIDIDRVKFIIGGMSSDGTIASAPIADEKKVLILSPVTGGENIDNAGEYIFRIANADVLAGKNIAEAMASLGYKKVASVVEATDYTLGIKKSFIEQVKATGGTVVIEEDFQPGTTDFRSIISKLKTRDAEAVLVASQVGLGGAHFVKQSHELGLTAKVFSDFTVVTNSDAQKIVDSFEGIYFADPAFDGENTKTKKFFDEYQKRFGKPSFIPFHAAATHDVVQIVVAGIKSEGNDAEKIHNWILESVKNWDGLMGTFSLDDKGNSDLGFEIKQIKNGVAVKVY